MTLNQAMHAECDFCGEMAMNHRLTDSGNFYCLVFNSGHNSYMRTIYPIISERKIVAQRAKCNELVKARFTDAKIVARTIKNQWRTLEQFTIVNQESLAI